MHPHPSQPATPPPPAPKPPHAWQMVTLGRICATCKLVQAKDEFDDAVPCEPH